MKEFVMKKNILIVIIILLFCVSCKFNLSSQYTYQQPENINDGLKVGSLDEVDIGEKLILKAMNKIHQGKYMEVHSMLIFKDDRLVFEEYFKGHKYNFSGENHHGELLTWDRTMMQNTHSATKSITSACIGIAIDKGFIESIEQSIFDFFPEHQHLNTNGKASIKIGHLLTMTSGLRWEEQNVPYSHPGNDLGILVGSENPTTYVLNRPLLYEPGKRFKYNGGGIILLGEIIKNATKMNIDEFSGKYLFGPLGIDPYYWLYFKSGAISASGDIHITPRDMVKIGVLFLNKGVWNGKQIISEQWVDKSAITFVSNARGRSGYSLAWWTLQYELRSGVRLNMFYAHGWGGQYIMVLPELNSVIVFTGANYLTVAPYFSILERYILPAFN